MTLTSEFVVVSIVGNCVGALVGNKKVMLPRGQRRRVIEGVRRPRNGAEEAPGTAVDDGDRTRHGWRGRRLAGIEHIELGADGGDRHGIVEPVGGTGYLPNERPVFGQELGDAAATVDHEQVGADIDDRRWLVKAIGRVLDRLDPRSGRRD